MGDEENVQCKVEETESPPMLSEMLCAMQRMFLSKAAGPVDIPIELLGYAGDLDLQELHQICIDLWESGQKTEQNQCSYLY